MGGYRRGPLCAWIDQCHARHRGDPYRAGAVRLKQLGFENQLKPIKVSCEDHEGARTGPIQTWDGKDWKISSDWYTSDDSVIAPMVKEAAAKYAAEKKITPGCLVTN